MNPVALDAAIRRFPLLINGARVWGWRWTVWQVAGLYDEIVEEYREVSRASADDNLA